MNRVINKIRIETTSAFSQVFDVFNIREDVLYYQPTNGGWSINQVLEHLLLANYFLLRIVNKQAERAILLSDVVTTDETKGYRLDIDRLKRMELTGSYIWVPQQYTDPSGEIPLLQLKMALHDQLTESVAILQNKKLITAIAKTYETGKIDALHYLYFLVQHMQRHLAQVSRVQKEFYQLQRQTNYIDNVHIADDSFCLN